ncbi:methyltransferase domain-containing protein [Oculatella sp. LEGE 06141]|uniref:methyltransferase domain-containing protein n=1 Tax=Oculatella sp. LEGE 06141 TaxID=1828648 RepID=UPI00187F13FA|nr:methyltransferase domain-containing protein [Oculatella sp. LEGE 06141]
MPEHQPAEHPPTLNAEFWEQRYQEGTTRWDLGQPAPSFVHLLTSPDAPKPGTIAVLGAGRGHDALLFAAHGFEVTGFDFAASAIAVATANAQAQGLSAQFLQRDIFALEPEFANRFDYVLEHTCFCAIAPAQRPAYVQLVHTLLRPQGELIAVFWAHDRPGGPPFGTSLDELRQQFSPGFDIRSLSLVPDSPSHQQNEEYFIRLRVKKSAP